MRPPIKYALIFFSIYALCKVVLFMLELQHELFQALVFGNMLFLLLAIFLALRHITKDRTEPVSFLADVKAGLQTAAVFALLVAAFAFVYYKWIDVNFMNEAMNLKISQLTEIVEQGGAPKGTTKHQYIADQSEQMATLYSAQSQFLVTLAALIMMGFVYSFLLTFLNRKVLSRFR